MAKWIELKNGELVNLDMIYSIQKYNSKIYGCEDYDIDYHINHDIVYERYSNETERNRRFEEVRAMLIKE